jgi:hypothetical protein
MAIYVGGLSRNTYTVHAAAQIAHPGGEPAQDGGHFQKTDTIGSSRWAQALRFQTAKVQVPMYQLHCCVSWQLLPVFFSCLDAVAYRTTAKIRRRCPILKTLRFPDHFPEKKIVFIVNTLTMKLKNNLSCPALLAILPKVWNYYDTLH